MNNYKAALQFNASVIVCVNVCFAANLDCCVFEVDSFVYKLRDNCLNRGNLAPD